jgi:hypothetical protein
MEVRSGAPALSELIDELHAQAGRLELATLTSALPEEADRLAIDQFLVRAYEEAWSKTS